MTIFTAIRASLSRLSCGALDPVRSWFAMLTFSMIALAGIIVWNVWAFDTIVSGGVIGTSATSTVPVFSQESLDTIRDIFEQRAKEALKYETGTYRFADPSQ
ncbi:MAG: hypothetical protein WC798_03935 [Candidatus Paceibacterota bacterium]|jgi:hypothetical protein